MSKTIEQEGIEIENLGMYEDLQIQPVNSWDLSKTTFIIPLRIESADRMRNVTTCLIYLLRNFDTQIIIKEHDLESIFLSKVVPMLDMALPVDKISKIHHIFEKADPDNTAFHRTRLLNDMLMLVKTPVVVNYDCDILLPVNSYILAQNTIINGHSPDGIVEPEPVKCIYPYGYGDYQRQLTIDDNDVTRFINSNFNFSAFNGKAKVYDAKFGFCQFFDTEEYIRLGGENEGFIAYGYEDDERYVRFNQCSNVMRMNELVFHMEHTRSENSWFHNPYIEQNRALWEKLKVKTRKQQIQYYTNIDYMTARGVVDGVRPDDGQE